MSNTKESRLLTTEQAYKRLGMSRATFFNRLKEHPDIKPQNYRQNLRRQPNPLWRQEDVDKLGVPVNADDENHVA